MRELRRDPTTGDWVAMVPGRPLPGRAPTRTPQGCPFCPDAEPQIAREIARRQGERTWSVRVVPEQQPAFRPEVEASQRGYGPYDQVAGVGAHEVIVESPLHKPLWEQPLAQSIAALTMAAARLRDLAQDGRFAYITWTRTAGGCGDHPRSRVIASPVVPRKLEEMLLRSHDWRARTGRELFQDIIDHERASGARVLRDEDGLIALCPWASRAPFEVWVLPSAPSAAFAQEGERILHSAARLLSWVHARLAYELDGVPHKVQLWTAPQRGTGEGFRWHFRIQPELMASEGGHALNPVPPEVAASTLRE